MLLAPWRWVPVRVAVEGWQSGLRAWWGGVRWCRRPCLCSSSPSHCPPHKTRPDLTTVCPLPPPAPLLCTLPFSVHMHSFFPAGLSRSSRSWAGSPCSPVAAQQTHPVGIGGKSGGGGCAELSLGTMGLWISGASRDFSSRPKLGGLLRERPSAPPTRKMGAVPTLRSGHPAVPAWSWDCPRHISPPHPSMAVDQSNAWDSCAVEPGAGLRQRVSSSWLSSCGTRSFCVVRGLFLLNAWVLEHLDSTLINGPMSLTECSQPRP